MPRRQRPPPRLADRTDHYTSSPHRSHVRCSRAALSENMDASKYGSCVECGRPMTDGWIARDPAMRKCKACLIDTMLESAVPRPRPGGLRLAVPCQRTG